MSGMISYTEKFGFTRRLAVTKNRIFFVENELEQKNLFFFVSPLENDTGNHLLVVVNVLEHMFMIEFIVSALYYKSQRIKLFAKSNANLLVNQWCILTQFSLCQISKEFGRVIYRRFNRTAYEDMSQIYTYIKSRTLP